MSCRCCLSVETEDLRLEAPCAVMESATVTSLSRELAIVQSDGASFAVAEFGKCCCRRAERGRNTVP